MTSKNLFFKLMREDGKQRLWSFVLAMIVFFFALPVMGASMISSPMSEKMLSANVTGYLVDGGDLFLLITFVGAMICGINGFSYLHSRKKVDFYHGIPVRREMLFAVSYLNGILIYLIPFLINLCLYLLIVFGKSLTPGLMVRHAFGSLLLHLTYYLMLYTVTVFTVMLTGNMLASVLGCLILNFYGLLVQFLNWGYHSYFYRTFWSEGLRLRYNVSPAVAYGATVNSLKYNLEHFGFPWENLAKALAVSLALAVVALLLYRSRPSESAEKAVAFPKLKPVVYLLISIPATLTGGWMIFGMICAWILSHGLLQIVMESEFKAAFRGGIKMAAAGVIAAVIASVFAFDLTGFDTYIPSESQFYSAAIGMNNLNENVYIEEEGGRSLYRVDVPIRQMTFTDYQALRELVEETEIFQARDRSTAAVTAEDTDGNVDSLYTNLYVKYCLKNGNVVYRCYWLTTMDWELVNRIYVNEEFKEGCYPILTRSEEEIGNAYFYNGIGSATRMNVSRTELLRLFRTFCEEYRKLTLYDMKEIPLGTLTFAKEKNEGEPGYYVYPSMTETIGLLTDAGMKDRQQAVETDTRITVSTPDLYYTLQAWNMVGEGEAPEVVYTGEKARQLLATALPSDWLWSNQMLLRLEEEPAFSISVSGGIDEYGNDNYESYGFIKGQVPDFVREDLKLDELERLEREMDQRETDTWMME